MQIAEIIVKTLEKLNVDFIFGIPGSQTCPFYDALYSSTIRHILVRHEQSAAYMADAYAKVTGRPGICDGTGGPGATNLMTGVATSWTDRIPVLVFTGQQPLNELGRGAFQELDHNAIFSPITKMSIRLSSSMDIYRIVRKAYSLSMEGRPGPVHIDMPLDIQLADLPIMDVEFRDVEPSYTKEPTSDVEAVRKATSLLASSHKPLIIAGGGVHYSGLGAWMEVKALAEYMAIPVATTFNGRGAFPEDHPLSAGRMGVNSPSYTDEMLSSADTIIAVGCRFAALSTRRWRIPNPEATLIHIDVDPSVIGLNYKASIAIIGDAKKIIRCMLEEASNLTDTGISRRRDWLRFLEEAKEKWRRSEWFSKIHSDDTPLKPQRVCHEIRRVFDRSTIFTLDAGNNKLWASTFLEIYEPRTWIQSGCFGPMGYALPAAISCKLVKPDRTVVAICGDGGFYMSLHELATSIQEDIPIIVCVFNDGALGTIKHRQMTAYSGRYISVDLVNPSFAKIAEAFGCYGLEVETSAQLRSALEEALKANRAGETVVLDIRIDGSEPLPP
ncbi:MAG: thiamine pyrophosphate-binding protein [Candidatus Bathyarchaeota archaeon]|nr:thiamine pyrophosphate-binding protein [Candidatus Bathyarchaeota archaeon]